MKKYAFLLLILSAASLTGCVVTVSEDILGTKTESQAEIRSCQTRSFRTSDADKIKKAVIFTLQDMGFIISHADDETGIISGNFSDIKMTVSVRTEGKTVLVRASAKDGTWKKTDSSFYRSFFENLSLTLDMESQEVLQ